MIRKLVSVGCALAALSVVGSALAGTPASASQATSEVDYNVYGNENFWAMYAYQGYESISAGSRYTDFHRQLYSQQQVYTPVSVFGFYNVPLMVTATANAEHVVPNNGAASTFTRKAWVNVQVMGNTLYDNTATNGAACGGNQYTACAGYSKNIDKTFFHAEYPFTVGPIPVTVSADIKGNAHASATANGMSSPYFGLQSSLYGTTAATLNAGAYLATDMHAFAGVAGVLATGVDLNFKLIDVEVTPTTTTRAMLTQVGSSNYSYKNQMPIALSTMGGSVTAWAQVPFYKYTKQLISWQGLTKTYYALNESGSETF